MQRWLSIPFVSNESELDLVDGATDEHGQVTDGAFPPTPQSLFSDPEHPPSTAPPGADWKRVNGTLYIPTSSALKVLPVRPRPLSGRCRQHAAKPRSGQLGRSAAVCKQAPATFVR